MHLVSTDTSVATLPQDPHPKETDEFAEAQK